MPCHPGHRFSIAPRDSQLAKVPHDFRDATRHEQTNRRMVLRPIRKHVDKSRYLAIDLFPKLQRWPGQSRCKGNGWHMQQQIR